MTIAILSDIHGNIYGLVKCIEMIKKQNIKDYMLKGYAVNQRRLEYLENG